MRLEGNTAVITQNRNGFCYNTEHGYLVTGLYNMSGFSGFEWDDFSRIISPTTTVVTE
jgi:hypothetical protein